MLASQGLFKALESQKKLIKDNHEPQKKLIVESSGQHKDVLTKKVDEINNDPTKKVDKVKEEVVELKTDFNTTKESVGLIQTAMEKSSKEIREVKIKVDAMHSEVEEI